MIPKPSRAFLLCMALLAASGAAGAWAWHKASAAPSHVRARSTFFELLRYEEPPRLVPPTPEEVAETRRKASDWIERMTAEFPELRIEERAVPDDRNGFLQLHLLSRSGTFSNPPISPEFQQLLDSRIRWDGATATRCLAEHEPLVSKLEAIAALDDRSSVDMPDDYVGFIHARTVKRGSDILLAKARIAAERGDEPETLRLIIATSNLANHYRGVETRTLLGETVALLIDLSVRETAFERLLPAFGSKADFGRWQAALTPHPRSPDDFADILRGEWHTTSRLFLLPVILREGHRDTPPDPEALFHAYASGFHKAVTRLPGTSLAGLLESGFQEDAESIRGLSKESRGMIDGFLTGNSAWAKGYCRAACIVAQHQAALDILVREQSGETLDAACTAAATPDPITRQPFGFDPATREITAPASDFEIHVAALKLPVSPAF